MEDWNNEGVRGRGRIGGMGRRGEGEKGRRGDDKI